MKGVTTRPEGASIAFLLVHGFCAAPDEVTPLGEYLADLNIASFAVEIVGHAGSDVDIRETTWHDWYSSVKQGFDLVKSWEAKYLLVAGLSMGGVASALLASQKSDIDGLVLMAPALRIDGILPKLIPILKYFMKDREIDVEKAQEVYDVKRTKCRVEPLSSYHELLRFQKQVRRNLSDVTIPTLVLQGTDDKTINPNNGKLVLELIGSQDKALHMIEGGEHVLTCHRTRETTFPLIKDFINRITG